MSRGYCHRVAFATSAHFSIVFLGNSIDRTTTTPVINFDFDFNPLASGLVIPPASFNAACGSAKVRFLWQALLFEFLPFRFLCYASCGMLPDSIGFGFIGPTRVCNSEIPLGQECMFPHISFPHLNTPSHALHRFS